MRSRIKFDEFKGDPLQITQELDAADLSYGLISGDGTLHLAIELQHSEIVKPAEALDQALPAGPYAATIRSLLIAGGFSTENITPDLTYISFEDLYTAAHCGEFDGAIDVLTENSNIRDWSWFVGDERDAWHSLPTAARLQLLTEWLTYIKEEYA